ncbi:ATP-binding protein [Belliella kenyensis]|uniref:histidine kinase n=1 Tax=Belliella kenyensis TaxID=1472724 RepID=A0ABV8EPL5_9BACT|nr:hybrid sensor histidine kinase/response regulator [Belliella kenyensis]MCH7403410.1 ATP-binding protein [Belliella kenyensis]MDN3601622.1 ATP-binding protein [Belliella kenyensis]
MKQSKNIFKVGNKVALGFFLAAFLVISVSVVTFFSIRNLLDTVENLSEPNEKLRQLNGLMADVYLLDMSKADRTSDKDSIFNEAYQRIVSRLKWLDKNAEDSLEIYSFEKININIQELLVSYAGLEEVRYRLTNRNFSQEALKSIEIKIKRQKQSSELEFLGNLRRRELFENRDRRSDNNSEGVLSADDNDNITEIVEEIEALNIAQSGSRLSKSESDSVLLALRNLVTRLYKDEQELRENFVRMEASLQGKNAEVFSEIQTLIGNLQRNLLGQYKDQNQSAYKLTYNVSLILGGLVLFGIVGSLGFVYTILKEVRQADRYREGLEEAKKQSDNLAEAKQNFLANMSHEIRNPLHAIQGYHGALAKSQLNEQQVEFVKMIGFASGTLMQIVNDILDFSKLEAGKIAILREPFDGLKLFHAIQSFFSFRAEEKGIDFDWTIELPEDKSLIGDELRVNQILNNLISNALKFTQEGSIKVYIAYEDECLKMEVTDTGIGMSEEVKRKVFDEFDQGESSVTRRFGGTGLGLSIVKRLVDLQSGEIEVESVVGEGSTIMIKIPMNLGEPVMEEDVESSLEFSLEGFDFLVVDDDAMGVKLIKLLLESRGAQVNSFSGGVDFNQNYKGEHFDLALIDIQMPEIGGVEVLELLLKKFNKTSDVIIAMTANVFAEEHQGLINRGFKNVLLKPFDESKIYDLLKKNLKKPLKLKKEKSEDTANIRNVTPLEYDLSDMKRFAMGDEELFAEIMQDFVEAGKEDVIKLESGLDQEDFSKIREVAHQLASRLGQIKSKLSEQAKDIEIAVKSDELEGVIEKTSHLISELKKLIADLEER